MEQRFKKSPIYALILSLSTLTLASCGQDKRLQSSDLSITNGIAIPEEQQPSVVLLFMMSETFQGLCTGTFVNHRQIVTAAHCVVNLDEQDPLLYYAKVGSDESGETKYAIGARALSYVAHPDYSFRISGGVNRWDLAVVNFPDNTAPAISPLAEKTPDIRDLISIVGYGDNKVFFNEYGQFAGSGAGVKRLGRNELTGNTDGMLIFGGVDREYTDLNPGTLSASGHGDSGGPLFVDGKLAGVTSGGSLFRGSNVSFSFYVDINSNTSQAFLREHLD